MNAPFHGLRVIDLSDRLSGAFAARLFGDFGAEVVLAESPKGHGLRGEPPFLEEVPGTERSDVHAYVNWNKRSIVINDEDELTDLVKSADVVITTSDDPQRPVLENLRDDTVHVCITAHGVDDSLTGYPGNTLTHSARVGWSYINGYRDEPPLSMPRHQGGIVGGVTGFITAAAALRRRDQGPSEHIDVSELEAFALTVHPWGVAAVYHDTGGTPGPSGGRRRGDPGPLWDLADGRMNFGLADFHNWTEAMDTLNLPELGRRKELIPDIGRHSQNMRDVVVGMAETLPQLPRWNIFHQLAKLRCVIGVVQDFDDIGSNEQIAARDFLVETNIEGQSVRAAGAPAKLSPSPWQLYNPAPKLDQDRAAVLKSRAAPPRPTTPTPDNPSEGPLNGIRVLSFGQAWSGTFGTELLALLGADVVQIGSLHRPDVFRRISQQVPKGVVDANRSQHPLNTQGHYNSVNLHKREVTLDLRQERGRQLLWQLLPKFDVLADNFRPTVMPSWGVTLEKLHEIRPGMIWASVSGYGETGPYWDYPANGATTEPMAGLSSIHGYEGDRGMNTGGLYPDPIGGYFLVATIMAALAHRDRTGEAQRVDLSMMEAVTSVCGDAMLEYDATGSLPGPGGNHHPSIAPHNNYETADGEWLALAAETDESWKRLAKLIGISDETFATLSLRKANETQLDEIIASWCKGQNVYELEELLSKIGIAAARVVPLYELYSRPDPHFQASGFIRGIEHPEAGKTWLPGRPWRFSAAKSCPIRPAPCVGQHSHEVLTQELGISDHEYRELVDAGITGTLDD